VDTVIVKGDAQWPTIVATLAVGFGAATIGALSIFALEVWRQILDFRGAARVVQYEMYANALSIGAAVKFRPEFLEIADDGWQTSRVTLALLLSEGNYRELAAAYSVAPLLRQLLRDLLRMDDSAKTEAHETLTHIGNGLLRSMGNLEESTSKSRIRLFIDALLGRTAQATAASPAVTMNDLLKLEVEQLEHLRRGEPSVAPEAQPRAT